MTGAPYDFYGPTTVSAVRGATPSHRSVTLNPPPGFYDKLVKGSPDAQPPAPKPPSLPSEPMSDFPGDDIVVRGNQGPPNAVQGNNRKGATGYVGYSTRTGYHWGIGPNNGPVGTVVKNIVAGVIQGVAKQLTP